MSDETVQDLLDAFVVAWRSGEMPDAGAYLRRASPDDADELARAIEAYMLVADDVEPSAAARERLAADPLLARLRAIVDEPAPADADLPAAAWGARLRDLRERAGLGVHALAARFAESFGLAAAERARDYLRDLEGGALDARGVSARAAFRLEELLGAPAGSLQPPPAVRFRAHPAAPDAAREAGPEDPAAAADLLRLAADALDRPREQGWDELDELLRGG